MTKLIRAEVYKLTHSLHLWLIGLAYLLLSSSLSPDYIRRGKSWFESSVYVGLFFYFMLAALATTMIGVEFDHGVIRNLVSAGNSRLKVFLSKALVFVVSGTIVIILPLLIHSLLGYLISGEAMDIKTMLLLIPSFIGTCMPFLFLGLLFRDTGRTLGGGLIFFVLMHLAINTAGTAERAVFIPYAQRLQVLNGAFYDNLFLNIAIDIIWIGAFLIASYAVFRRCDLK